MNPVFFYGLFMDVDLLKNRGLHPRVVGQAALSGYQIRIADRATLVRSTSAIAYGLVIELPDNEVTALYSGSDVRDYRPVSVEAVLLDDGSVRTSWCYVLPDCKSRTGSNEEYARKLAALVSSLGFCSAYAEEILH